jgi:hypothetical protein
MAKNIGIIKFKGALGDLVGYERNGKQVLQRKGGFNGERIKTEARYEGTRKRQSEFGLCARVSSLLHRTFAAELATIPTPMVYNYIQSQVMAVKNCDVVSEKGQKTFAKGLATPEGQDLFADFQFHLGSSLSRVVSVVSPYDYLHGTMQVQLGPTFKNKQVQYGVGLIVLDVHLDTLAATVTRSPIVWVSDLETIVSLEALPDNGGGSRMVFLSVIKGQPTGGMPIWFRDKKNVLGLVDLVMEMVE